MPKLRLALSTGFSHWFHDPDSLYPDFDRYMSTLESGWNFSAQAVWFPWAQGGIGAEWIWFLSKASDEGVKLGETDAGHSLRHRASYIYYGPTFMSRVQFGRFGLLTGAFGAGMLFVKIGYAFDGQPSLQTATTYAFVPQAGWEYSFYRLLSMGVNVRGILATVTEFEHNGKKVVIPQPVDESWRAQINMYRFEVNAVLVFGL